MKKQEEIFGARVQWNTDWQYKMQMEWDKGKFMKDSIIAL